MSCNISMGWVAKVCRCDHDLLYHTPKPIVFNLAGCRSKIVIMVKIIYYDYVLNSSF